jgi:hypothetical protein
MYGCRWDALQRLATRLLLKLFYAADTAGSADESVLVAAAANASDRSSSSSSGDDDEDEELSSTGMDALVAVLKAVLEDSTLDGQYQVRARVCWVCCAGL